MRIDPLEDFGGDLDTRGHGGFLGENTRGAAFETHEVARREIAAADVFGEGDGDGIVRRAGGDGQDVKGWRLFGHGCYLIIARRRRQSRNQNNSGSRAR